MDISNALVITILVVALINALAVVAMGLDKTKSIDDDSEHRTPELNLFMWAICFGSLGVLIGMLLFRHKIRKIKFLAGITLLLLQHLLLAYLLITIK